MNDLKTTKEYLEYNEAQSNYLKAGKAYAKALEASSKLDPRISKVVKEITDHGKTIHLLDSKVLTGAYNQVLSKTKIEPKYRQLHEDLLKSRSSLENAEHRLSNAHSNWILRKAGIQKGRHELTSLEKVRLVNSPQATMLEKIVIAAPYLYKQFLKLESFIDDKEILVSTGELLPQTRDARSFLKSLEAEATAVTNDSYFLAPEHTVKDNYIYFSGGKYSLLELLKELGDSEHVREFERRLYAGDIALGSKDIIVNTDKGARYRDLLTEELLRNLDLHTSEQMLALHKDAFSRDPLYLDITKAVDGINSKTNEYRNKAKRFYEDSELVSLFEKYNQDTSGLVAEWGKAITNLEKLSATSLGLRKLLLFVKSNFDQNHEQLFSAMSAARLLARYEQEVQSSVQAIANKLGVDTESQLAGRFSSAKSNKVDSADKHRIVKQLSRDLGLSLSRREKFSNDLDKAVAEFVKDNTLITEYQEVAAEKEALHASLYKFLEREPRLDVGAEYLSESVGKLIELEVRRQELFVLLLHQVELAHKKIWLKKISEDNKVHINGNLGSIAKSTELAHGINTKLVSDIEKAIEKMVAEYDSGHREHSEEFLAELAEVAQRVASGEDITKISTDLKKHYQTFRELHRQDIESIDREMKRLDKALLEFPEKSRKAIEKSVIADIKNRALK